MQSPGRLALQKLDLETLCLVAVDQLVRFLLMSIAAGSLPPREQDVTILVCKGLINEQIALCLKLPVSKVKSYLQNVFFKIGVRNRQNCVKKLGQYSSAVCVTPGPDPEWPTASTTYL